MVPTYDLLDDKLLDDLINNLSSFLLFKKVYFILPCVSSVIDMTDDFKMCSEHRPGSHFILILPYFDESEFYD